MTKSTRNGLVNWTMVGVIITLLVLFFATVTSVARSQAQIEANSNDIRVLQDVNKDIFLTLRRMELTQTRMEINLARVMDKMGVPPVRQPDDF